MKGKQKQAQRTKNNVRPSNSGRSAELLENTSGKLFTALTTTPNYIGTASNQDAELNIPQEFQLCVKKMNKKDPVTRQKGLQEFAELCSSSNTELLKTLLPYWPRLYNNLATDIDCRVREAAQQAHRALVVSVKRDVAPFLKQLMGTWFVSRFDSHQSAANVAKSSFQAVFPQSKRTEAIVFAQKEILNYIVQNIIHETPDSLFTQSKHFLAEDINARYQRIVGANLLGYSQYLDQLPRDQLLEAKDDNKELILSTNKFWKYAKDESKAIKAAWFTVLLTLLERAPEFLDDYHKKVCTSIFTNFDDEDSNVLPSVWETAIRSCDVIKDWWAHVSADKLVFPKLWRVLHEAAFGHAVIIHPLVLSLLSRIQLPESTSAQTFYKTLLSNLRSGLAIVRVQRSTAEVEAIARTYFECLRYIVNTNLGNMELCLAVIGDELVTLMKSALEDSTMYVTSAAVFSELSSLLNYWSKIQTTSPQYAECAETVWSFLHCLICGLVTIEKLESSKSIDKDEVEKKLKIQYKVLHSLKHPPSECHPKKHARGKINASGTTRSKDLTTERAEKEAKPNIFYVDRVRAIVNDLIKEYYRMTDKSFDCVYLFVNQLCSILNLCSEKRFYQRLTDLVVEANETENAGEMSQLINNLIRSWLSDNRVSVDAVLNVVFYLLIYLRDDERVSILNSISKDHMSNMLELCLNLANDTQLQTSVQKWLTSSSFKTTLSSFAREVTTVWPPSAEKVNILKTCFREPKNGESYTNDETKLEILDIFRESLTQTSPKNLHEDNLACIAEILMEVFEPHNHPLLKNNHALVTSIIGFLFLFGSDTDNNVKEADVLNKAWSVGVRTLAEIFGCASNNFLTVTEQFAFVVIELVEKSKCKARDMKHLINYVRMYIECLPMAAEATKRSAAKKEEVRRTHDEEVLSEPAATYAHITSLICEVFLKIAVQYCHDNMESNIVSACLKSEFYNGTLTYWNLETHDEVTGYDFIFGTDSKLDADIRACFTTVSKLFDVAYYIVSVINHYLAVRKGKSAEGDDEKVADEDATPNEASIEPFLSPHGLEKLNDGVVYVVYLLTVLKSFHQNFKHANFHDQIMAQDLSELESLTRDLIQMHPRSPAVVLKVTVMNKALECGNFWAEALFLLFTELMPAGSSVTEAYQEVLKFYELYDRKANAHILHVTELFAARAQLRLDKYSPEAKLDEEKLSVLTCFLRANKEKRFTPDQDRIIWYWLDAILIQRKQLEVAFNKNLTQCKTSEILLAATVCRFLSVVADSKIPLMTDKRTDFMMIALASWMQSVHKTCANPTYENNDEYNMPICIFISAVCEMFKSITKLASNASYSDKLFIEWNNVFASETHTIIAYTWKSLSDSDNCRNAEQFLVLNTLSEMIATHVDFVNFVVRPDLDFWVCACAELIQNYCVPVRLAAYHVLLELSSEMVKQDSLSNVVDDLDEKLTLECFSLEGLQNVVNIVLATFASEDDRAVDSNTDLYGHVHSYLLAWMVVIKMCEKAETSVRFRYGSWLKDKKYLGTFLHNLIAFMPEKMHRNNLSDGVIKKMREYFSTEPNFSLEERWDEHKLSLLVCRLYYLSLWLLPAFVRKWWQSLEKKDSQLVEKLTTKFVSPILIMEDMKAIKSDNAMQNFTMKGYPTTRQIVAAYSVEDTTLEMTVQLTANHPLGVPKVDSSNVGLLPNKWKEWAKQLIMYLTHQNGLIRDGIMTWKRNVDKAFEGVEECYICFSVIHGSNYQLPKQSCQTCSKKFHPLCLYRWFITSNKSACPICRNHF